MSISEEERCVATGVSFGGGGKKELCHGRRNTFQLRLSETDTDLIIVRRRLADEENLIGDIGAGWQLLDILLSLISVGRDQLQPSLLFFSSFNSVTVCGVSS